MTNAEDAPWLWPLVIRASSFVIRISSLSLLFDQLGKLVEKVRGIVWAGCGFRMILHAKDRQFLVPHSLDRAVIQIDVR